MEGELRIAIAYGWSDEAVLANGAAGFWLLSEVGSPT